MFKQSGTCCQEPVPRQSVGSGCSILHRLTRRWLAFGKFEMEEIYSKVDIFYCFLSIDEPLSTLWRGFRTRWTSIPSSKDGASPPTNLTARCDGGGGTRDRGGVQTLHPQP